LNLRPSKARIRACELIGPGAMRNDGQFSETGSVKAPFFFFFLSSLLADAIFIYTLRLLTFCNAYLTPL
jgi:hypothetical protein